MKRFHSLSERELESPSGTDIEQPKNKLATSENTQLQLTKKRAQAKRLGSDEFEWQELKGNDEAAGGHLMA